MRKKKSNSRKKIIILIIFAIILIFSIWRAIARYTSTATAVQEIEIAMYVLEEDYQSMNLNLGKIVPRTNPYTYDFIIANYNEEMRTDVDLEYTLKIRTTTNIPLDYELYLGQKYNDLNSKNITLPLWGGQNIIKKDEYGTDFREITVKKEEFTFEQDKQNKYQLVVYFPSIYKDVKYQDLIESVEIIVESKQIIET